MKLVLSELSGRFAICRVPNVLPIPLWAISGFFFSITRTLDEMSIVCQEGCVPHDIKADGGWSCLKLEGPFSFELVGILRSVLGPLADAKIPVLALSTFDTDYVLIKENILETAISVLAEVGHEIRLGGN